MEVVFTKQFNKDIQKLNDRKLAIQLEEVIKEVKVARDFFHIHNLKKLKGYSNHYRIRIGNYRVGIFLNKNTIEFCRFMDRKEIYRYFP